MKDIQHAEPQLSFMKDIQRKELFRSLAFIKAIGCQYLVITPDGERFSVLNQELAHLLEAKPRVERRALKHPYGEVSSFYRQYINLDCEIGDVQEIPFGRFAPESIRSGVCSYLSKKWGTDTYSTNITPNRVEVLRIA
jgi:hypothetical protein